tara:strand:+ start:84 stop:263 length:180 start_codon:yes stop_codon:yes gene_type:complete
MADEDLPPSYVKRCKRLLKKFNRGFKPQATSPKLQATSLPQSDYIDPLQKINRKELKKL